jgi:hypothetical protein
MRGLAILALPLLLAACESRETVSICAAVGDPAGTVTAAFHDAEGVRAVLFSDAGTGEVRVVGDTLSEPVLPQLWRLAETTMRSLPDSEPSPCGLDTLTTVTVTFSDGSTMTRVSSCSGNALSRVADGVFGAAETDRAMTAPVETGRAPVATILEACEGLS